MSDGLHLVCTHCNGVNRLPAERNPGEAKCGRCHEPLFDGHPANVSGAGLEAHVSRGQIPVVADFWADWCGPCHMMAPAFAEAARTMEPQVRFVKVDTEADQQTAMRYAIRGIPTLILFRDGRELTRQSGAMSAQGIVSWLRSSLS